ncbi:ORF MSV071 hypothetical protein [Melanoplus sanguinipes entomopoxvirus]|uniref:Uncharacterized protein n=1 Tax=Melanoplus sanguinipes entomopoxvirus TaxID=83191 RepID=Q9YW21_MSEPV|nr:ORF MSV071 hypothetical protein [Melanoplus sanguinipes entomopoxvirus]AAC97627.1 ORF MSV071 hypothetical protein [Melanoplus sanguinipes entomopoxvirus 'O']
MENIYNKFVKSMFDILESNKDKINIALDEIDYEQDSVLLDRVILTNNLIKNFATYDNNQWENSLKYIPLSTFSFYNNYKGDIKYIYNFGTSEQKKEMLENYKQLVYKLYGKRLTKEIINTGRNIINESDKVNFEISELIKESSNYKNPTFIAHLIDLIVYNDEIRNNFINSNPLFEKLNEIDIESTIRQLIISIMNIQITSVSYMQSMSDVTSTYIKELFNNSKLLSHIMDEFKSDTSSNYNCGCNEILCNNMLKCNKIYDDIKIVEKDPSLYRPSHIKKHIRHVILKIINILYIMNQTQMLHNKKIELFEYIKQISESNDDFIELLDKLNINSTTQMKWSELIIKIYENRDIIFDITNKYKEPFFNSIIEYINKNEQINDELKSTIIEFIKEHIETIDLDECKEYIKNIDINTPNISRVIDTIEKYLSVPLKKQLYKRIYK